MQDFEVLTRFAIFSKVGNQCGRSSMFIIRGAVFWKLYGAYRRYTLNAVEI